MKRLLAPSTITLALALLASAAVLPAQAAITSTAFNMVPSAAAKTCLKGAKAAVVLAANGAFEELTILAVGLPANATFTVFTTQVPNSPFGLSMYLGDIQSDARGDGIGRFVGRFSTDTFIVSPGVAPAPQEVTKGQFPDAKQGVKVGPIQLYHLGMWFNSPAAAVKAHCANTVTPFNSGHDAGIQVLTTSGFPEKVGPLHELFSGG